MKSKKLNTGKPLEPSITHKTLKEYVQGNLSMTERLRVEAHLKTHPDDREIVNGLRMYYHNDADQAKVDEELNNTKSQIWGNIQEHLATEKLVPVGSFQLKAQQLEKLKLKLARLYELIPMPPDAQLLVRRISPHPSMNHQIPQLISPQPEEICVHSLNFEFNKSSGKGVSIYIYNREGMIIDEFFPKKGVSKFTVSLPKDKFPSSLYYWKLNREGTFVAGKFYTCTEQEIARILEEDQGT